MGARRAGLVSILWVFVLLVAVFTVALNVPVVKGSGTIYIREDGSIDPPATSISSMDNVTYAFTNNIYNSIVVQKDHIIINGAGYTVQGPGSGTGIELSGRINVTVQNVRIEAFDVGVNLDYSCNNTVSGSNITANNGYGLSLDYSRNNTVSGNNITENNYGVIGRDTSSNTVSCNNIEANKYGGIFFYYSCNSNTISGNNVANFRRGIYLFQCANNTVSNNDVVDNSCGIYLCYSSNNTVSDNNMAHNSYGIELDILSNSNTISGNNIAYGAYGVSFEASSNNIASGNNIAHNGYGIYLSYSSNNEFYHNNFVINEAYVTAGYTNVWDNGYPSGGNYWSTYNGRDQFSGPYQNITGSDFIGDTAYEIEADNVDHYPIMIPCKTAPPTIIIASPENKTYAVNAGIPLTFTVDEFPRWIGCSLNGQPNATITGNATLPTLSDGHYYVIVYANNTSGSMGASDIRYFAVDTILPTANAGDDQTVSEDTFVTLDASASTDEIGIAAYTWTFTDVAIKTLTGEKPTYTFNIPGVYTITLNVTDTAGNSATDTVVIAVLDVTKPVANAGQDQTVSVGVPVSFDAVGSTDNVGIVTYEWDSGDGTIRTGRTLAYTYAAPGTYIVTLTVKDEAGNIATDFMTVTVRSAEVPPPPETFLIWTIAGAIIATGIVIAIALLWKQRKQT